jgi:hypothetical protein
MVLTKTILANEARTSANQYKKFSLEHIANFSLSGSLCVFVFAAVIKITFGQ